MTNRKVNIINYISEGVDENFQLFIRGHLYLEALLSEIIDRSYKNPNAINEITSTFYKKVKLVRAVGRISEDVEELLLSINLIRNRLAHKLDFTLNFDIVFELVQKAHSAEIDFSDDQIYLDKAESQSNYGIYGVVNEVMCNIFSHLIWENEDIFTKEDISHFLG